MPRGVFVKTPEHLDRMVRARWEGKRGMKQPRISEGRRSSLLIKKIINKYLPQKKQMTRKEETLHIIKKHNLGSIFIANLIGYDSSDVRRYVRGKYVSKAIASEIENAVLKWKDDLYANRSRLLKFTPYAHIY